ncbi:hypothetical protein EV189_3813 [Motilibacter rhizosphaerae]|uniref:Carboxypeptidase family protein n=1 Tax=Motilibacter rhizosphaerae TaxID=598652 RepID=A0A4Q7NBA8_9ACTN|nr:hypothetical protein [Motilibacter rhizosphaerae]RZS79459.1 hypothetical protein EV189_3813 [Motilibacter rhizosphaerae]
MVLPRRALLAALAAALPLTAGLPSAAADTAPSPTASGVTLTAPAPLTGTAVGQVVVHVHLTDPSGVTTEARTFAGGDSVDGTVSPAPLHRTCPCALLASGGIDPQAAHAAVVGLHLVSGTVQDGDWTGSAPVTAAQAGRWAVDDLVLPGGALVPAAALAGATALVVGRDAPVLSIGALSRTPVPAGSRVLVGGRVLLGRTGRPAAGLRLAVWTSPLFAAPPSGPVRYVRTDATGHYAFSHTVRGDGSAYVLSVSRVLGDTVVQQAQVRTSWLVTPVAARGTLVGSRVVVTASVPALRSGPAELQRLRGRRWTTVAAVPVVRGRAVLRARGAGTYRVLLPRDREWRSGVSGALRLSAG